MLCSWHGRNQFSSYLLQKSKWSIWGCFISWRFYYSYIWTPSHDQTLTQKIAWHTSLQAAWTPHERPQLSRKPWDMWSGDFVDLSMNCLTNRLNRSGQRAVFSDRSLYRTWWCIGRHQCRRPCCEILQNEMVTKTPGKLDARRWQTRFKITSWKCICWNFQWKLSWKSQSETRNFTRAGWLPRPIDFFAVTLTQTDLDLDSKLRSKAQVWSRAEITCITCFSHWSTCRKSLHPQTSVVARWLP